ncbi:serine/threonine-protein kinase [Planctomyces sp. SH-PL14]|uniref:serine/threonine-protein kinase n=1 Tax=Planctomyces sp. SH-PL14 TaxID=1632864 RepID=UPI0018D2ADE6|nr:serine/threonine-protein kinase [Planctomyces sp. SH-PL14]
MQGFAAVHEGGTLGPYRLVSHLGSGGMGTVYRAEHVHLEKIVALKILPAAMMQNPLALGRFKREMKAVGKLSHPHIVQAFDAGEVGGVHYLAMEFIDGIDLQRFVRKNGPMNPVNAAKSIRQAALGLSAAHAQQLYHRDIKPANLLVTKGGQIKVLDLGLARLGEESAGPGGELTALGETMGTPDYMAPEQWSDSRSTDARTDLYALGCTLFFLLTGRAPFAGEGTKSTATKMKAHLFNAPPDLQTLRSDVPAELVDVCRKLLAKDPADRYQTAMELADVLASMASSQGPQSALVERPSSVPRTPSLAKGASSRASDSPAKPGRPAGDGRRPPATPRWKVAAGGLGAAAVLLGVIVITITNRDGTQTRIEVPATADVKVTYPDSSTKPSPPPAATSSSATPSDGAPRPPAPAPAPIPWKLPAALPDREIAEWVLRRGGSVVIEPAWKSVARVDNLPAGSVVLRDIAFTHLNKPLDLGDIRSVCRAVHLRELAAPTVGSLGPIAEELARLPRLHVLGLGAAGQSLEALAPIGRNKALVFLSLSSEDIGDGWPFLAALPTVRTLKVWGAHATTFDKFGTYPGLKTLFLTGDGFPTEVAAAMQAKNPNLRIALEGPGGARLIGNNPLREPTLQLLRRGVELHGGHFGGPRETPLTEQMVAEDDRGWQIGQIRCPAKVSLDDPARALIPALTDGDYVELDFSGQVRADRLAVHLGEISRIWGLNLNGSDITDEGLKALAHVIDIRNVQLKHTRVTAAGIQTFRQFHPTCIVISDFGEILGDFTTVPGYPH